MLQEIVEVKPPSKRGRKPKTVEEGSPHPVKNVLSQDVAPEEVPVPDVPGKRKRKPALNASEYFLESNVAKRKKPDSGSSGTSTKKKPVSTGNDEMTFPKNAQNLPKLIVPEITMKNSVSYASEQLSAKNLEKSSDDPKAAAVVSNKPKLIVPQVALQKSQEISRKSDSDAIQDKEKSDKICDIDENSGSVESEHREEDSAFSSDFLEDEFLMDVADPPKLPTLHRIKIEVSSTPPAKGKRGRPSKKGLEEKMSSTPISEAVQPISEAVQPITETVQPISEFATPTEKPKRGRKKKDPNALPETPEPEVAVYESVPGKRIRKKIDYRELSGEIEAKRQPKETSTPTVLATNSILQTSIDGTSLNDLSINETPTPQKSKRGRKRRIDTDISTLSESMDTDTSIVDVKSPKAVICGKCESVFKGNQVFLYHAAAVHGGVVSHHFFNRKCRNLRYLFLFKAYQICT